jgi:hypothetical protein
VVQKNLDRYPLVRMRNCPRIEVHIIPSTEAPSGAGEAGVPGVAPALVNAIAALTGVRHHTLPLAKAVKAAVACAGDGFRGVNGHGDRRGRITKQIVIRRWRPSA